MNYKRVRITNLKGVSNAWWYGTGQVKIGDEFDVYVEHPAFSQLKLYPSEHNDKMFTRILGTSFHKGRGGHHNFNGCFLLDEHVVDAIVPITNREASSNLLEQEDTHGA